MPIKTSKATTNIWVFKLVHKQKCKSLWVHYRELRAVKLYAKLCLLPPGSSFILEWYQSSDLTQKGISVFSQNTEVFI